MSELEGLLPLDLHGREPPALLHETVVGADHTEGLDPEIDGVELHTCRDTDEHKHPRVRTLLRSLQTSRCCSSRRPSALDACKHLVGAEVHSGEMFPCRAGNALILSAECAHGSILRCCHGPGCGSSHCLADTSGARTLHAIHLIDPSTPA